MERDIRICITKYYIIYEKSNIWNNYPLFTLILEIIIRLANRLFNNFFLNGIS